jgi:hypothetical protein
VVELAGHVHTFSGNITDIRGLFGEPPELAAVLAQLDAQAATVSTLTPHTHPEARPWDAQTVDAWLLSHARAPATRALITWLAKISSGLESWQMSHLFWLLYLRHAGGALFATHTHTERERERERERD